MIVWLVVGIVTAAFALIALFQGSRSAVAVLALLAGLLLALGGAGIWP
jgi:hypothetical protein